MQNKFVVEVNICKSIYNPLKEPKEAEITI